MDVVSRDCDGIMAISLMHKISKYRALIVGMYVPPENSIYGDNADMFFDYVTNILYENTEYDLTLLCGDMNSRIGKGLDYIENIDNLPDRVVIDDTPNNHGQPFIDFMLENKLAVVNGRICPLNDNWTCVSTKGKSVVDYFVIAQENIENVVDFKVHTVSELLELYGLNRGVVGRVSDHSILSCSVIMHPTHCMYATLETDNTHSNATQTPHDNELQTEQQTPPTMPSRFKVKKVPNEFLNNSDNAKLCIQYR